MSVPVQVPPGAAAAANERNPVGVATPHPSSDSAAGNAAVGEGGGQSKKTAASPAGSPQSREAQRLALFDRLLGVDVVDLVKLRGACWSGIPPQHRATCWQLLLGYLPSNREWREETLQRKRREYWESVPQYFDVDDTERSQYQRETLHQILMDVPRTSPSSRTFHHEVVQRALERILYIWALRHPASGYVQGINDLVTPFFMVFLSARPCRCPTSTPQPFPPPPFGPCPPAAKCPRDACCRHSGIGAGAPASGWPTAYDGGRRRGGAHRAGAGRG